MTIGELQDTFNDLPRDEEAFIQALDTDGLTMHMLVTRVTTQPEGIMIEAGEEVEFGEAEEEAVEGSQG